MNLSWLFLLNVGTGLLLLLLGIPLAKGKVRPNRLYGFRTKKTLSDESVWYIANRYAGKFMMKTGLALGLVSLGLYLYNMRTSFLNNMTENGITILWLVIFCIPI